MEKDSYEEELRGKVLQAEAALSQNSDKERVWNSIQKRRQPQYKWYYAAAAMLFIIGMGSVFYIKNDEVNVVATKTKVEKTVVDSLPKPPVIEAVAVKYPAKRIKKAEVSQLAVTKLVESAASIPKAVAQKEGPSMAVLLEADKVVAVIPKNVDTENKVIAVATSTVPEFTIQFKRGVSIVNSADDHLIITTLKKFKLKRDTPYFANAEEKQPIKLRLTFKREN